MCIAWDQILLSFEHVDFVGLLLPIRKVGWPNLENAVLHEERNFPGTLQTMLKICQLFVQGSKQNKSRPELRRTSSCDKWEENIAESVANELMLSLEACEQEEAAASSKAKAKDPKQNKAGRTTQEEKKGGKASDDKKTRPKKLVEFHNIKISQVSYFS